MRILARLMLFVPLLCATAPQISIAQAFTSQHLQKILNVDAALWQKARIDRYVAPTLGIALETDVEELNQLVYNPVNQDIRLFNRRNNGEYILSRLTPEKKLYMYRVSPDLKLLGAAIKELGKPAVTRPLAEAQKSLPAELAVWREVADKL